jgi:hypothetical protein
MRRRLGVLPFVLIFGPKEFVSALQQIGGRRQRFDQGFVASAQNPASVSATRTPENLAAVSVSVNPLFGCPECRVKASAILPPGFITRRISRSPLAAEVST